MIKNKKLKVTITITKIDATDNTTLAGAQFEIRDSDNQVVETKTTGSDGNVVFDNLNWDIYTLVETEAPEGYRMLLGKTKVEIDKNNIQVIKTIENTKIGWTIPQTGGIGTLGFYGVGLILMVSAVWFMLRRRQV